MVVNPFSYAGSRCDPVAGRSSVLRLTSARTAHVENDAFYVAGSALRRRCLARASSGMRQEPSPARRYTHTLSCSSSHREPDRRVLRPASLPADGGNGIVISIWTLCRSRPSCSHSTCRRTRSPLALP